MKVERAVWLKIKWSFFENIAKMLGQISALAELNKNSYFLTNMFFKSKNVKIPSQTSNSQERSET
jgi:hypothetical protein